MTEAADNLARGVARSPGPSYRDFILRDQSQPPSAFLEQSYEFQGDEDIPYSNYTSNEHARAEFDKMWPRVWQWACREEHIPNAGDYYVYDVGHLSAIVLRTESGAVKAFHNACMHRGTQLKQPASCGTSENLRCPFHGWTYSLDGELIDLPGDWDFPHVSADSHRLPELQVGTWAGFVFVNFDPNAGPLDDYLGVLPRHFADFHIEDRYIEIHLRKRLPSNWKASAEAFLEAYHVRETHAGGHFGTEVATQYDVFGDNVTRFIHTVGSPSPLLDPPPSEQTMLDRLFVRGREDEPVPQVPEGMTARDVYGDIVRKQFSERYNQDFSHVSTSQALDSIEYFLFPNAFFFPGLALPMVYRFRPDPENPDFSTFDLLFLRPKPLDGPAPPPPDPIDLDVDDSYSLVEGLGRLGGVYDQDTTNLAAQTRGFKSSFKRGQTLGNYQEIRARHLHAMVGRYIAGEMP
jgi:phenylpropionate dioxygenase-like ring-hydroxylating dioxygenase large terminal subunit